MPFHVHLPTHMTGFAPDLDISSSSVQWFDIEGGGGGWRHGDIIIVPDQVFEERRRVNDESAYTFQAGRLHPHEPGKPEPGGIVLLLESPHRDEFDGRWGHAIGPLRDSTARASRLLVETEHRLGKSLDGRTVNVVNAVQYQTSLQALMSRYEGSLRSGVRTPVWHAVFDNGGDGELLARLDRYEPTVVLTAPTGVVKRAVRRALQQHAGRWPWQAINYHPSYWSRRSPVLDGGLHLRT